MDDNIQNQIKQIRADQACFILGTVPLELADELNWITNPGIYYLDIPRRIRALDLSNDWLHPFQGIPHEYLLNRRKQMLSAMRKIYFASIDLNALLQNDSLSQYQLNFSEIENLFEELREFENTNSLDAQMHFDEGEINESEEYRAELQDKIINAVKEYEDHLNQYLGHLTETLTGIRGELLSFFKKIKKWLLQSQKKLLEDGDESNVPLNYITVVRRRIIRACKLHPKLYTLAIFDLDSSRIEYNTRLSQFLTKIEEILQNHEPPEAQQSREPLLSQEPSDVQETCEAHKSEEKGPLHVFLNQDKKSGKPQTTTEWYELGKKPIVLFQEDVDLPYQEKMVLIRLLFEENVWVDAGDIAEVDDGWSSEFQEGSGLRQKISAVITKLEAKLGKQLGLTFAKGINNKLNRPIQRSTGENSSARYRIDLNKLESLRNTTSNVNNGQAT